MRLINKDEEDFGVVVQYIVVPNDAKREQIHLYEPDGVEFIEKSFGDFETETKYIFYHAIEHSININDYIIRYSSKNFENMTLGEFFQKAIPIKGIWLQRYLIGLRKNCFEFCISTINKFGVQKKKKTSIERIKRNIREIIDTAQDSKHYQRYVEGFENLFRTITENDI